MRVGATPHPSPITTLVADARRAGWPTDRLLARLARAIATAHDHHGVDAGGGPLLDGTVEPLADDLRVPAELLAPQLLGDVLELSHEQDARRRQGAFFTPHHSAAVLVQRATEGWDWSSRPRVCDPSCGGGAFLLAAAQVLESRGLARGVIVDELLFGIDADPLAVATTRAALALWAGSARPSSDDHVVVGDTLVTGLDAWGSDTDPFDLVLGNPPFQSQLARRTARTAEQAEVMRDRFGPASRTYADSSTLFLLAATAMTADGGRCTLLLPESFLSARDAAPARAQVVRRAALIGVWLPKVPLFRASVRVCAPVLEVGAPAPTHVQRWVGADAAEGTPHLVRPSGLPSDSWGELVADLFGVPTVELLGSPLGRIASATAGFRDQFYGVRQFVRERVSDDREPVRLMTSGSIDLVNDLSTRRAITFAGATLHEPVVDIERLRNDEPALARWAERVLVPKVVVATQTRVIEVLVDETGLAWPSVPVIAVLAPPDRLWPIAAVLASPPVCAHAMRHHVGAALTGDAIKLSARQVLSMPLPKDHEMWTAGTEHLRAAAAAAAIGDDVGWTSQLVEFGSAMCRAYRVADRVLDWWAGRLPAYR